MFYLGQSARSFRALKESKRFSPQLAAPAIKGWKVHFS